jgi:hypothetical protein
MSGFLQRLALSVTAPARGVQPVRSYAAFREPRTAPAEEAGFLLQVPLPGEASAPSAPSAAPAAAPAAGHAAPSPPLLSGEAGPIAPPAPRPRAVQAPEQPTPTAESAEIQVRISGQEVAAPFAAPPRQDDPRAESADQPARPPAEEAPPAKPAFVALLPPAGRDAAPLPARPLARLQNQAAKPAPASPAVPPAGRDVEIHIGRIEVVAMPPAPAPAPKKPVRHAVNLDDYLKRRR